MCEAIKVSELVCYLPILADTKGQPITCALGHRERVVSKGIFWRKGGQLSYYGAVQVTVEEEHSRQREQHGENLKAGNRASLRTCRGSKVKGVEEQVQLPGERSWDLEYHTKGLGLHCMSHLGSGCQNTAPQTGRLQHTCISSSAGG